MYTPEETKLLLANHNECTFSSNELYASALKYIQQLECGIDRVYKIAKDIKVPTTKPKWISVEERLPEHLQYVLTAAHDGEIEVMYYNKEWPNCFCLWSGNYKKFNVTHWMPLPVLPDEAQKDTTKTAATGNGVQGGVSPDNAQE